MNFFFIYSHVDDGINDYCHQKHKFKCSISFPGSQHSGTNEEDFTSNDLENSKQENTDKEQDTEDEEGLDCKCVVCDRQCQDIDQ